MPLRKRISLAAAAAAAFAVAIAVLVAFMFVRDQLRGQVDDELRAQASAIQNGDLRDLQNPSLPGLAASAGGPAPYWQVVLPNGDSQPYGGVTLPDIKVAQSIAAGTVGSAITSVSVNGAHLRMFTFEIPIEPFEGQTSAAIQLARPLAPVDNVLSKLKLIFGVLFFLAVALAVLLASLAARRVLAPLAQVTETAQLIGETDDLDQRIDVETDDEVGQLARSFNGMLERLAASRAALDDSVTSQRQLVADASHELRTPITSLRTNIEVLLAQDQLDPEDRRQLLGDVVEQSEELTALVSDLIEVARGDLPSTAVDDVRLDLLVEDSIARARRNSHDVPVTADLVPTVVSGNAERLSRAINNLLDNAVRHTAPGTPVEVFVDAQGVRVRDHGHGIDPGDLPHVFDRFYRGANSRAIQGSGLGLAIVKQVAEQHHGRVTAENADGGGALFTLMLPANAVEPSAVTDDAVMTSDLENAAQKQQA